VLGELAHGRPTITRTPHLQLYIDRFFSGDTTLEAFRYWDPYYKAAMEVKGKERR
jgi:hypothetical protein